MGRLGPLTSQALGRSPYDDVVQGTGEIDPSAPLQLYDDRGRPVNAETKRINKDIIRSHNEVMQVIGVAEPDHPVLDPQLEKQMQQDEDEDKIGRRLTTFGRTLGLVGVWGVNGIRLRNLLFQKYSSVRFFDLYRYHRSHTSFSQLFLAGLPSFVAGHAIKLYQHHQQIKPRPPYWVAWGLDYVHLHLQSFVMMQRVGLTSAAQWFPHPLFFVPFTAYSPVPPLPSLQELSRSGVTQWLGTVAMNVGPAIAFAGFQTLWVFVMRRIWINLYSQLPSPGSQHTKKRVTARRTPPQHIDTVPTTQATVPASDPTREEHLRQLELLEQQDRRRRALRQRDAQSRTASSDEPAPTPATEDMPPTPLSLSNNQAQPHTLDDQPRDQNPATTALDDDDFQQREALTEESQEHNPPTPNDQPPDLVPVVSSRNGRDIARSDAPARVIDSPQATQEIDSAQTPQQREPLRQRNASTRGDYDVSEDEDTELVNATLISFDVEATESAGEATGVWSAELRPSTSVHPSTTPTGAAVPMYADNSLTRLPLVIATDVLTLAASYTVVAPYEAFALRWFARAIRGRRGMGVADIGPLRIWESVGWTSVTTFLGIEFVHLIIDLDYWSVMWALARLYRGCKAEWGFWKVINHNIDLLDPLDGEEQ